MRIAAAAALLAFIFAMFLFRNYYSTDIALYGIAGIVRSSFYIGLLMGTIVYGLIYGGQPERIVAAVLLSTFLLDPLLHQLFISAAGSFDPAHLVLDTAAFLAFTVVALNANRLWTLWLSALQLITLLSHAIRLFDVSIHPTIYVAMQVVWSYPALLLLAIGTANHRQRLTMVVEDRSWSSFSPLSRKTH